MKNRTTKTTTFFEHTQDLVTDSKKPMIHSSKYYWTRKDGLPESSSMHPRDIYNKTMSNPGNPKHNKRDAEYFAKENFGSMPMDKWDLYVDRQDSYKGPIDMHNLENISYLDPFKNKTIDYFKKKKNEK